MTIQNHILSVQEVTMLQVNKLNKLAICSIETW